ncbi:RNA dependent RNA polymerase-domain-containing protein [Crucibulum laeve]|uniref:RNA-dependent RNA polymerase n=1 Tax=Crucibulum laeve TaxID=68775 RepID=A0A5C3M1L6_9AGAR|nr:RNA dependent RNA polymerase-domain-containing protein [Crucibulum laeve]
MVLLSQTDSEDYGENDISHIILEYEEANVLYPTQPVSSKASDSASNSFVSLGKRKSSNESEDMAVPIKSTKSAKSYHTTTDSTIDPYIPYTIAHSSALERLMEKKHLPYGVKWEIARLISLDRLNYGAITEEHLELLKGTNHETASKVANVLLKVELEASAALSVAFASEKAVKTPWQELDTEERALSEDIYGGLGHNPNYPDWYGGKVEFRAKLAGNKDDGYKITLERCTLGASSRFTRRFGSWSFIRVKIPLQTFHKSDNGLNVFFKKAFVIWGNVFRACYAKDQSVFLFRTNELCQAGRLTSNAVPGMSLEQLVSDWHNPLAINGNQLMTKWSARTALGFSNSIPGPMVYPDDVTNVDDIVCFGSEMTDGCGLSNKAVHLWIRFNLGVDSLPTAFQFRRAGCKGMSLLHDDGDAGDGKLRMQVRPSQTKIKYSGDGPMDPAHCIVDVLRLSHMRTSVRIAPEIIVNLHDNGVRSAVFVEILKNSIGEIVEGLTTWEGPDAMYNLWRNVERAGGVCAGRRARQIAGEARFRGFEARETEEDDDMEEDDEDGLLRLDSATSEGSTAWWADETSGCPSSLEETVMVLLDSGFTPKECPILREKLRKVVETRIKSRTEQLRLDIEQSASAFVVPDPYGVLNEDEIQIKSSHRCFKTEEGLETDIIVGDVLMTRNPCKVPSDVRKVRAVEHPLLRNLVDVIVCTVKGHRRLLDFLGGGDYDGDKAYIIWAYAIVELFRNADEKYSLEPPGLDFGFERDTETGTQFLERAKSLEPIPRILAMQDYLLGGLRDTSMVGKYSKLHDNAIYMLGYGHPRTVKLAAKFCRVLDGPKTGWKIRRETWEADKREYYGNSRGPEWKPKDSKKPKVSKDNSTYLPKRSKKGCNSDHIHGPFVMDTLRTAAKSEAATLLARMDVVFSPLEINCDPQLTAPWTEAVQWAEQGPPDLVKLKRQDLDTIVAHVQSMYVDHRSALRSQTGSTCFFTTLPIEERQDIIRGLSKEFFDKPVLRDLSLIMDQSTLARLRASYAYQYDAEQNMKSRGWSRFPWNMAMRELCSIKAVALGPYKTVTNGFYERFRLAREFK